MIKNFQNKKIIIMSGFPGSGKSTLAKKIAHELGFKYLSTDIIRKELFNSDRFDAKGHEFVQSITNKIYNELYNKAVNLVKNNQKVIIDGTHLYTKKRKKALDKITQMVNLNQITFITVKTPAETIEKRMKKYSNQYINPKENTFQAWQRVFSEFKSDQKKGLISWPNNSLKVDVIDSKDIYEQLA